MEIVTFAGSRAEWVVIGKGTSPGRILADGYIEPDWHWVRLRRYDGRYPDFTLRESEASIRSSHAV